MRFERRSVPSPVALVLAPLAAVAFTLGVCAALVMWAGAPVGRTYAAIVQGGFGSLFAWSETLTRAVPLMLTGLAATVAFKARLYNIGAEGQLYGGAMAAVMMGTWLVTEGAEGTPALALPAHLSLALVFAAAACVGALLLLGPAWLKARLGVDEVVTTLLLNFVILLAVSALLDGPMKDPAAMGWPQSVALPTALELVRPFPGLRLHSGMLIAVLLAVALWAVLRHTVLGFQIRASGANARAAAFAGVPALRTTLVVALLSGGLAGLAGAIEVAGRTGYVTLDMSPGYGYSGIVIAMLAGLHPLAVLAASIFVAGMLVGADSMSRVVGVPTYIADVVVATSLIAVLVATMAAQYRVRWVRATGPASPASPAAPAAPAAPAGSATTEKPATTS
jgi:simple sugar transport system permease protein